MSDDIGAITVVCKAGMEDRRLERTLMGGTKAIREAGKMFTPQYEGEDEAAYKTRLASTFLFNGFEDAVKTNSGKVTSKDVVLNDDVPEVIRGYSKNIDGQGRNLTAFTLDAFREAVIDGLSFIYVDFTEVIPPEEGEALLSDQIAQGARPNAILYQADQIIGFKHANINGQERLTQIRIFERVVISNGQYGEEVVNQIRLLEPGRFELWHLVKQSSVSKEQWVRVKEGVTSIQYIPIVPVYTNRTGYMTGRPPLKALAELNLEHWISSSDQRAALTFARFAMMAFSGVQPGTIKKVGPSVVIELSDPNAKWGKIETSGEGITAGRLDLEAIEKRMQSVGMTIQVQNTTGDITATAASIDSDEANSALLAAAGGLEDSLDQMLQIFADYERLPTGGSCTVNKQFGQRKSTATVTDLNLLYTSGLLDGDTVLSELQKRGDLSEDLDLEEVARKIRETPPNLLGQNDNNSL